MNKHVEMMRRRSKSLNVLPSPIIANFGLDQDRLLKRNSKMMTEVYKTILRSKGIYCGTVLYIPNNTTA